jgi:hypothetical protein
LVASSFLFATEALPGTWDSATPLIKTKTKKMLTINTAILFIATPAHIVLIFVQASRAKNSVGSPYLPATSTAQYVYR